MNGYFEYNKEKKKTILHISLNKRPTKEKLDNFLSEIEMSEFEVVVHRRITAKQHNTIFALYNTLKNYTGHEVGELHSYLFLQFQITKGYYDLSTSWKKANSMSVTQAQEYIDWLLIWGIENGYPLYIIKNKETVKPQYIISDIRKYEVACIMNKTCTICGSVENVTIHHVEHVNRIGGYEFDKGQLKVTSLCSECHSKIHSISGDDTEELLYNKYHLQGVLLSEYELLNIVVDNLYPSHFKAFRNENKRVIEDFKKVKEMIK